MRMLERLAGRLILIVPIVCAALLASPGRLMAQDGTSAIIFTRATVVFPAAIQFVVGVNVEPDTVARATLTVAQAGETLFSSEAGYEQRRLDAYTELIATWTLDHPPYPRAFAPLAYEWTVETVEGDVSAASGEVVVVDPHFEWRTAGEPPLTLHWHNDRLNGAGIRTELAPVLAALREHTGRAPEFEFVIYDPAAPLCPTVTDPATGESVTGVVSLETGQVFDCSAAQIVRAYESAGVLFVQRPSLGYTELRDLLAARMAGETYAALWDEAGADVPAWFAAGLAALYRPRADLAALGLVRAALNDGATLPAETLAIDPPDDAPLNERALWEAQSAVLVRYLADRHGPDAPFEIARALAEGEPFEDALAALDETLPAALWDTWAAWAASDEAERAAVWTPYQSVAVAPTATPTRAPTATLRPTVTPTLAPSATPTAEPRFTPTVLGNFAPQVIVGQAPTEPPLTPTNTALPPGSLPSATPRAEPLPAVDGATRELDTRQTAGVALLASGGVLFVIAIALLLRDERSD